MTTNGYGAEDTWKIHVVSYSPVGNKVILSYAKMRLWHVMWNACSLCESSFNSTSVVKMQGRKMQDWKMQH